MGTRGFVGFKKDGEIKGWYNHYDSYPEHLGRLVVDKLSSMTPEKRIHFFENVLKIHPVDDKDSYYANHRKIMEHSWAHVESFDLQSGGDFYKDGLFCEYAYIYNLNTHELELYKGFGTVADNTERKDWFSESMGKRYYVNCMGAIPMVGEVDPEAATLKMFTLYGVE